MCYNCGCQMPNNDMGKEEKYYKQDVRGSRERDGNFRKGREEECV